MMRSVVSIPRVVPEVPSRSIVSFWRGISSSRVATKFNARLVDRSC